MPVVSNTSPVLNLAVIGQLDLLAAQFNTILIPEAVQKELHLNEDRLGVQAIRTAIEAGWLRVMPIQNDAFKQVLARELDEGEAEALVLALETKAERILLDEREARRVAQTLSLPVTGVIGILLAAKRAGRLSHSLTELIHRLQDQAGFWLAPSLVQTILKQDKDDTI